MTEATGGSPLVATAGIAIRVEQSIDRIAADLPAPLSALAGIYQSRGWLAAMERMSPVATRYLVASEGDRLLGLLPVYLLELAAAGHYRPRLAFGNSDEPAGPIAVLGGRAGYTTGWMLGAEPGRRASVLAALLTEAAALAAGSGAELITAQYLPAAEAALLCQTGWADPAEVIAHSALAQLELPGTGFADYLATLPSSHRSTVRRDLARFARSGFTLSYGRLSEALSYGPELLAAVAAKHGGQPDVDRMRRAMVEQAAGLDEVSTVVTAAPAGGRPAAFSLSYTQADTLFVRLAGLDHARAEASGAYFVTTYYEPIRLAYQLGLRRVHVGIASYRPKVLRGAALAPLYGILRRSDGAAIDPGWRRAVPGWLMSSLRAELGALTPPAALFELPPSPAPA
ncbi:MAG: GNAT family N-acetyltransferase [Jatrophihabitans sp.]